MTYKEFIKKVRYTEREIYIPILDQYILKSSFMVDGEYSKEKEKKFLKLVYDKRKARQQRELDELSLFESIRRSEREAE